MPTWGGERAGRGPPGMEDGGLRGTRRALADVPGAERHLTVLCVESLQQEPRAGATEPPGPFGPWLPRRAHAGETSPSSCSELSLEDVEIVSWYCSALPATHSQHWDFIGFP